MKSPESLEAQVKQLQQELFDLSLEEKKCQGSLQATQQLLTSKSGTTDRFLDKIYNPLSPPENVYKSGSFSSPGYDSYTKYQMTGFLTGNGQQFPVFARDKYNGQQFPVFARDKYNGRGDKQEYYTINEGRNKLMNFILEIVLRFLN